MITAADINLKVVFNTNTKKFSGLDLTDYTGLGEPLAGLYGLINATDPTTLPLLELEDYTAPWIDLNASILVSSQYDLPLDTNLGTPLFGVYTFDYTVQRRYSNVAVARTASSDVVTVIGDQTANIIVGSSLILDNGDGDDGTYTVTGVVYNDGLTITEITLSAAMTVSATDSGLFVTDISRTYEFCFEDQIPDLNIQLSHSCNSGIFKSLDATDYGDSTLSTRTHRLMFPKASTGVPVAADVVESDVATSENILVSNLWTGTYQASVISTGNYVQADGLEVLWSISGVDSQVVTCRTSANKARVCILKMLAKYQQDCRKGTQVSDLLCDLVSVNTLHMAMQMAEEMGQVNEAEANAISILEIANNYGCGCTISNEDGEPERIIAGQSVGSLFPVNPLTTAGDIYYRNELNENARLPVGTPYHVLTGDSPIPSYQKPQGVDVELINQEKLAVPAGFTIPGGYLDEDFEGVYEEFNVRSAGPGDVVYNFNGTSFTASGAAVGFYTVRFRLYRLGTDWLVYLTVTDLVTSGQTYQTSSAVPAVGAFAFDQDVVVSCTSCLGGALVVNNYVCQYFSKKKFAV